MRGWTIRLLAVAVAMCVAVNGAVAEEGKDKGKKRGPEQVFKHKDTNGDQKLSLEEFKKNLKPEQVARAEKRFSKIDTDGDKSLSLEEFKKAAEAAGKGKKKDGAK